MSRSPLLFLAACLISIQLAGCTTMASWRSADRKSTHSAKPKSMKQRTADCDTDEDDEVEEHDDSGNYVGDENGAGLAREEALDPWFGKYDYADKGRAIERNLR